MTDNITSRILYTKPGLLLLASHARAMAVARLALARADAGLLLLRLTTRGLARAGPACAGVCMGLAGMGWGLVLAEWGWLRRGWAVTYWPAGGRPRQTAIAYTDYDVQPNQPTAPPPRAQPGPHFLAPPAPVRPNPRKATPVHVVQPGYSPALQLDPCRFSLYRCNVS